MDKKDEYTSSVVQSSGGYPCLQAARDNVAFYDVLLRCMTDLYDV